MSVWLLMMRTLAHYNYARFKRLKEIEDLFDKELSKRIKDFFTDNRGFNLYTSKILRTCKGLSSI